MNKDAVELQLNGKTLTLSSGDLAKQAHAAVLARYGDTLVLATVVAARGETDLGYFPLTVEYIERLYAGGRIKGSRWVKREGRPSDESILSARLIDRSIRPLFPKSYKSEVQVAITVLSVDSENDPAVLGIVATSAALTLSAIPWDGPIGGVRVGLKDGTYFTNPTDSELVYSDLDLVVSSTKDAVVMVEAGAKEVSEEAVLGGIEYGLKENGLIVKAIEELAKKAGVSKTPLIEKKRDEVLIKQVEKFVENELDKIIEFNATSQKDRFEEARLALTDNFDKSEGQKVNTIFEDLLRNAIRKLLLSGKRPDGRKPNEIRNISALVGVLPRTHGSALFTRGQTQVLTITTLGSPSLEQLIESAQGEETKRYMHHYSMPPFASGETGKMIGPGRRDIGHGALAERALLPVIPAEDKFPYTIRLVSEVLSSNGSTSMAAVCGSTLSLMDAGVPIIRPVSGIAMGAVVEGSGKFVVLSDILGLEDGMGDMDFKVAGTEQGVTALQLDVKIKNLTPAVLKSALLQAKEGRKHILSAMLSVIDSPREKVSQYAPKVAVVHIPPEKIGEVIGPGGRVIRQIIAETGAQVDVEDDKGTVNVTGLSEEAVAKAVAWIEGLTREVKPGEIYDGVVKRIQPFGAFVEILPGKEGLVHVSDLSDHFVRDPGEIVSVGQRVRARVKEIDELKRVNLSMNLDKDFKKTESPQRERDGQMRGRDRVRRVTTGGNTRARTGPHFPATRFLSSAKGRVGSARGLPRKRY